VVSPEPGESAYVDLCLVCSTTVISVVKGRSVIEQLVLVAEAASAVDVDLYPRVTHELARYHH
jgi:hypothetical protein